MPGIIEVLQISMCISALFTFRTLSVRHQNITVIFVKTKPFLSGPGVVPCSAQWLRNPYKGRVRGDLQNIQIIITKIGQMIKTEEPTHSFAVTVVSAVIDLRTGCLLQPWEYWELTRKKGFTFFRPDLFNLPF